jgi:hypothetical protein
VDGLGLGMCALWLYYYFLAKKRSARCADSSQMFVRFCLTSGKWSRFGVLFQNCQTTFTLRMRSDFSASEKIRMQAYAQDSSPCFPPAKHA